MNKKEIIALIIIAISFALGIYFYPQMPAKIASHWNAQGAADDYMNKFWGIFLLPIISLAIFLLFWLIQKIDPLKENINKFKKHLDGLVLIMVLFLFYLFVLTIFWNMGIKFNMSRFLLPALGIVFFYAGILMENAKRNWFVGVRTPWTLSSENVWNKTNKLGGKLFKIIGAIALLGILLPDYVIFFVIAPAILGSIYLLIYSYIEYQKEIK